MWKFYGRKAALPPQGRHHTPRGAEPHLGHARSSTTVYRREEKHMNRVYRLACIVVGLACLLGGTPSWGASWNPTASDSYNNTAGGTAALAPGAGFDNTAFGFEALHANNGSSNTACGSQALMSNTTGSSNTACGAFALFSNTTGSS